MTDAELDKLDRLSAEKIMGWKFIQMHDSIDCWDYGSPNKIPFWGWRPTRDTAQAFELLHKLGHYDYFVGHGVCKIGEISVESKTMTEAIVRAVLKSKGVSLD